MYALDFTLYQTARGETKNKIFHASADFNLSESSFDCPCKAPECTGGGAVDAGAVVAVAVDLSEHQAQRCDLHSKKSLPKKPTVCKLVKRKLCQ